MMRFLPGRVELAMFAGLAVVSASIVAAIGSHDAGLSIAAFPIFIFAAIMGLWKSGRLRSPDESADI